MARTDLPTDPPLTEADIQAFADGSLSPERAARVQRYLGDMPGEASRIAFYRRLNGQFQRAFEAAPAAADDARFIAAEAKHGPRAWLRRAGRVLGNSVVQRVVLLALAVGGWTLATVVPDRTLHATAVTCYEEIAADAGAALQQMAAAPAAGPGAAASAGTAALVAPVAAVPAALAGRGAVASAAPAAQVDPFSTEFAQLGWKLTAVKTRQLNLLSHATEYDYRNAQGQPVVLLTTRAPFAPERPHWMGHRMGELRLLTWTTGGKRYVLAGRADTRGLMKAADAATFH